MPERFIEYLRDSLPAYYSTPWLQGVTGDEVRSLWQQELKKREEAITNLLEKCPTIRFKRFGGGVT